MPGDIPGMKAAERWHSGWQLSVLFVLLLIAASGKVSVAQNLERDRDTA